MKIIDFHIHTHHSYDCNMNAFRVLETAKKRGLDCIAICDHDTIKGGLEVAETNKDTNFEVIVGAEIFTDIGDVSGLFLKEEIESKIFSEVVQEIKNQDGIVILNHPYKNHKLNEINFDGIDLIEGYNSRVDDSRNELAVKLARETNKPIIGGSDAHLYSEIANCKTFYESNNFLEPQKIEYKNSRFYCEIISQFTKVKKKKELRQIINFLRWTSKYIVKRLIYAKNYANKRSIIL